MTDIGAEIRRLRKERGYSIAWLAYKCGVSHVSISHIENHKRNPSVVVANMILNELGHELTIKEIGDD